MKYVNTGSNDLVMDFLRFMVDDYPDLAVTVQLSPITAYQSVIVTATYSGKSIEERDPNLLWALHHLSKRMRKPWRVEAFTGSTPENVVNFTDQAD